MIFVDARVAVQPRMVSCEELDGIDSFIDPIKQISLEIGVTFTRLISLFSPSLKYEPTAKATMV